MKVHLFYLALVARKYNCVLVAVIGALSLWVLAGCETVSENTKNSGGVYGFESRTKMKSVNEWIAHAGKCIGRPVIVGHRGAPGYTPEHTLKSYSMALDMGADYIEPDLVMTKDGVLIARHENEISQTTDVEKKYPNRKNTKVIENQKVSGWFTEDFTLAEIKNLRAKERLDFRSHKEDGLYEIPTFEEILVFVKLEEKKRKRMIGIAPELKHSTYFRSIQRPLEETFIRNLKKYKLDKPYVNELQPPNVSALSNVLVQSFEVENLKMLRAKLAVGIVQLLDDPQLKPQDGVSVATYGEMATAQGLKAIGVYADWVSPSKDYIVKLTGEGEISNISNFIQDAHAVGLKVLPYTFRSDGPFLAKTYKGQSALEYELFFSLGVDGIFTDFADQAVAVRSALCAAR